MAETSGTAFEKAKDGADTVIEKAKDAEHGALDALKDAQQTIGKATPVPTEFKEFSTPSEVNDRLKWGEPALTILDVRDRESFNDERIMGAVYLPKDDFISMAKQSMAPERSIYVYGADDSEAQSAAAELSGAGYKKVSILKGGLAAWKAINGATEGRTQEPGLLDKGKGATLINQNSTP